MLRGKRDDSPAAITVRRIGPSDTGVLTRLALDNGRFGAPGERLELAPLPADDTLEFLEDDRTVCLVAFAGEEPVGFLYACELYRRHTNLRHLCMYEVGVADDHRGQGIGAQLIEGMKVHARARGIDRGFVITHEANRETIELYKAAGGKRVANDDVVIVMEF